MSEHHDDGFYHGYEEETPPDTNRPPAVNNDALARMDAMLNEYRHSHGLKSPDYYENRQRKHSPEPTTRYIPPTYEQELSEAFRREEPFADTYDSEEVRRYAHQRDARAEMDDMIRDYQQKHSRNTAGRQFLRAVSSSPFEIGRRRSEFTEKYFPPSDPVAQSIKDPQLFQQIYPDARTATTADALGRTLLLLLMGLCIFCYALYSCVQGVLSAEASAHTLASYTPVSGVVAGVYKYRGRPPFYTVSYDYEYQETTYRSSSTLYNNTARPLGLTDSDAVGRTVTVYVNPDNPKQTMLATKPYPAFWYWLLLLPGAGLVIYGIKFYLDCKKGRRLVYHSNGIKHFKSIKHFTGA